MRRHEHLFHAGDRCRYLYALRGGAVKSWITNPDGEERIIGLYLPGDLVGLDGLATGVHSCTAGALESTATCRLPVDILNVLAAANPHSAAQTNMLIGEAIAQSNELLVLLGKKYAMERMALFLLNLSMRLERRGFSRRDFSLSMSRRDIGNYLGLALGTVCRLLGELKTEGVLSVHRRHIHIRDLDRLRTIVGESTEDSAVPM